MYVLSKTKLKPIISTFWPKFVNSRIYIHKAWNIEFVLNTISILKNKIRKYKENRYFKVEFFNNHSSQSRTGDVKGVSKEWL